MFRSIFWEGGLLLSTKCMSSRCKTQHRFSKSLRIVLDEIMITTRCTLISVKSHLLNCIQVTEVTQYITTIIIVILFAMESYTTTPPGDGTFSNYLHNSTGPRNNTPTIMCLHINLLLVCRSMDEDKCVDAIRRI